ncbi:Na+/H+ antiporter subunit E [Natronospora cellulosivora (SeqCode)]
MRQKLVTFITLFIAWIIFSGGISFDVLFVGTLVSLLTTSLFHDMLFRFSNHKLSLLDYLKKFGLILLFIPVFFYEAINSALKVSIHVFEKKPSFSPGIVKVKTHLTNVTAISILANLITLTPGTMTLDFDKGDRVYYIHWIDVKTREEAEARREIIERFESWLDVIFK